MLLAEVFGLAYRLAARNRWMDLVEVIPIRQAWAAAQQPDPLVDAFAAKSRAGTFVNWGDFEGGLTVVDQAIVAADTALTGPQKAIATGRLHLRGMKLAGRLGERAQAQRHIQAAWVAAEQFPADLRVHGEFFGPADTASHVLATEGDLGRPREVIRLADQLFRTNTGLPSTRIYASHVDTARAHLDLGDRDSAQTSLIRAWDIAPHPGRVGDGCAARACRPAGFSCDGAVWLRAGGRVRGASPWFSWSGRRRMWTCSRSRMRKIVSIRPGVAGCRSSTCPGV